MRAFPCVLLPLLLAVGAAAQQPDAERTAASAAWVAEHARPAADYVVGKFAAHDCVLLGETHGVRQNCAFVAALLPRLRAAGVHEFATEFLRASQSEAMNRIVTAAEYDEPAVVALMRAGPWPTWGYQDYADIFKAVWQVNRDRAEGAVPLRVIGLDSDWTQYELWFGGVTPQERMEILLDREGTMVDAVADGPLAKKEKVLVHCGFAHAVTCQGERLGAVLLRRFADRVFQITLHHELRMGDYASWITPWLEGLVAEGEGPVGFDLGVSPFADLRDEKLPQFRFLQGMGLGAMAMGYVVLTPAGKLQDVRWIPGFITRETFADAREIAIRMGIVKPAECEDAAALDARMRERYPR